MEHDKDEETEENLLETEVVKFRSLRVVIE
jgi:hypothetical protein